jgi:hypothetical protein
VSDRTLLEPPASGAGPHGEAAAAELRYVKAYLKRSKNDANDAAAICEAVTRPSMRFVATKSEQQQSGLMLHRRTSDEVRFWIDHAQLGGEGDLLVDAGPAPGPRLAKYS